jgi:uncharacterized repeat protein (TIGR01451 family)
MMERRLQRRRTRQRRQRLGTLGASVVLALALTLVIVHALSAQSDAQPEPAQLTGDQVDETERNGIDVPIAAELELAKAVDEDTATAGDTLNYTIVIDNIGDEAAFNVFLTDTLPSEVTMVPGSLSATGGVWDEENGYFTWTGPIMNQDSVEITFQAEIEGDVVAPATITNVAEATWDGNEYEASAVTMVTEAGSPFMYLPITHSAPPPPPGQPALSATRPTFENKWLLAWTNPGGLISSYELQESLTPDFASPTTYAPGLNTSLEIQQPLTFYNEYYYRVRAVGEGGGGPWSNVVNVTAAYRDDFDTSINNWAIRRTTLIEEVQAFHEIREGNGLLIVRVEDSWDWGIASPLIKAPAPPYVIEYRTQVANTGNLVSHGLAYNADFPGPICPDWSSLPGVYEHNLCFNHFNLNNVIFYGPLKMQFERVDFLFWCPSCGGSPMKRLSNDYGAWFLVDPLGNAFPEGWNTWKVEVRSDGLRFFLNGQQYSTSPDTTWVNEPYFGAFGSTDEYSNSTTRWDYVEVRPLDN